MEIAQLLLDYGMRGQVLECPKAFDRATSKKFDVRLRLYMQILTCTDMCHIYRNDKLYLILYICLLLYFCIFVRGIEDLD